MSDKLIVACVLEAALFLGGIAVLWRYLAMRRDRPASPLPLWTIPGHLYALAIIRVVAITFAFQLATNHVLARIEAFTPESRTLLGSLSLQVGLGLGLLFAWWALKSHRLQAHIEASLNSTPALPARLPTARIPLAALFTFLAIIALVAPLTILWTALLQSLRIELQPQNAAELLLQANSPVMRWIFALFAVVIVPIVEEALFRCGIFRYLRGRIPPLAAIVGSALFFGAAHLNLGVFVPLTVFGVVQAIAYERTGRVAVPIIAHALFNLHTMIFFLLEIDPYESIRGWLAP
jgi:Predicted metal-dependent membrane protease